MSDDVTNEPLGPNIRVLSGFAFPSTGFNQLDGLPLIRIRDLANSDTEVRFRGRYDPAYLIKKGDVLIGMDGDFEVYRWTGDLALLNQRVCKVEAATRQIDQEFLYWYLKPRVAEIHRRTPQTTVRHLSANDLYLMPHPPIGAPEQQVVAQILDTLDTAIHETEAIIAKLKAVKQGLLHDLLTRGIDANGELRPPQAEAPHLYKESPLGWIPKAWEVKTVSEVAEVKSGATPSREQANRYFSLLGIPWVKTLDLNEDLIRATDEYVTATALRETSCSLLPEGTVLVAMYGGWEQIGRTALLAVPAATNQAISSLLMRSSSTVPEFVLRALQHSRPRWHRVAASTRKDPNITKADVLAFEVPVPAPDEQTEIICRLRTSLDRLEFEGSMLAKLRHQKAGLMEDLLTGRVRVTPLLAKVVQPQGSA